MSNASRHQLDQPPYLPVGTKRGSRITYYVFIFFSTDARLVIKGAPPRTRMIYRPCCFSLIRWDQLITSCLLYVPGTVDRTGSLLFPSFPYPLLFIFSFLLSFSSRCSEWYLAKVREYRGDTVTSSVNSHVHWPTLVLRFVQNKRYRWWTGSCKFRDKVEANGHWKVFMNALIEVLRGGWCGVRWGENRTQVSYVLKRSRDNDKKYVFYARIARNKLALELNIA